MINGNHEILRVIQMLRRSAGAAPGPVQNAKKLSLLRRARTNRTLTRSVRIGLGIRVVHHHRATVALFVMLLHLLRRTGTDFPLPGSAGRRLSLRCRNHS
jgi:hypothetical protein